MLKNPPKIIEDDAFFELKLFCIAHYLPFTATAADFTGIGIGSLTTIELRKIMWTKNFPIRKTRIVTANFCNMPFYIIFFFSSNPNVDHAMW